jgi:hypothetical protein
MEEMPRRHTIAPSSTPMTSHCLERAGRKPRSQVGYRKREGAIMEISLVFEHALISMFGWFSGIIAGGGLGYLCALMVHSISTAFPKLRKPAVLLPWRTVIMALLLFISLPVIVIMQFGLGAKSGTISVGMTVFLLALVYATSILLEHWHANRILSRLISGARTLATASPIFTALFGFFGGGGAGSAAIQSLRLFDFETTARAYLSVILLILFADILLGLVHYFIQNSPRLSPTPATPGD